MKQLQAFTPLLEVWDYDESHQLKIIYIVGSQTEINASIEFMVEVTAAFGFHSFFDWCY